MLRRTVAVFTFFTGLTLLTSSAFLLRFNFFFALRTIFKFCDGKALFFNFGRSRSIWVNFPLILCSKYRSISLSRKCLLQIRSPFIKGLLFRGTTATHLAITCGACNTWIGHDLEKLKFLAQLTVGSMNILRVLSKLQLLSQFAM